MSENKTQPNALSVDSFLRAIPHETRRADAMELDRLFRRVTGWAPRMWGDAIVGYGQYHYIYDSGREGDFLATGFSPRKANMAIYIMPGYADYGAMLDRLGRHKLGKSCLYVNKLADVDLTVVEELVRAGLDDLGQRWTIHPT